MCVGNLLLDHILLSREVISLSAPFVFDPVYLWLCAALNAAADVAENGNFFTFLASAS